MAERADRATTSSLRELVEEMFFAGVGAIALTKDRADDLVDELTKRGRLTRDEARELVDDVTGRWRGEAARLGERASSGVGGVVRELALGTRGEGEDAELRLSQLEHRLRLLEAEPGRPASPGPAPGSGP